MRRGYAALLRDFSSSDFVPPANFMIQKIENVPALSRYAGETETGVAG